MNFIHQSYVPGDTIAAIATPLGEGGIAIIRISGKDAILVADKVFSGDVTAFKSHTAHLGFVINKTKEKIDQALLLVMHGPNSYTGEDTVEIQCHGGTIAARKVLEIVIEAGARHAAPGEFTFKAYMNGKLDLAQAEAVQQLIGAKSDRAFQLAKEHLQGKLSKKIELLQEKLITNTAILEAYVDFPEEAVEVTTKQSIQESLSAVKQELDNMIHTFHDGRKLSIGAKLCLLGPPNAGKSSIMNALADQELAIVTPIPGTTRDLLKEELTFNGRIVQLFDTAGIRETGDIIEKEGVRRSYQAMKDADLILLVLDATQICNRETERLLEQTPDEKTIVIWNKIDLPNLKIAPTNKSHFVQVSAKNRIGFEELRQKIELLISSKTNHSRDEVIISGERHLEALKQAAEYCSETIEGLNNEMSYEFLVFYLRQALNELGKIIGKNISEDILSTIFSKFCIGK